MAEVLSVASVAILSLFSSISLARNIQSELLQLQDDIQSKELPNQLQQFANQLEQFQRLIESANITSDETKAMERDLSTLDRDKLILVVKDLRDYVHKYQALWFKARIGQGQLPPVTDNVFDMEIQRIKKENRKLSDKSEKQDRYIRELHRPRWVMAEDDYPDDEPTWSCFSDPVPTVLVYDSFASGAKLRVGSQNEMKSRVSLPLPTRLLTMVCGRQGCNCCKIAIT